MLTDYAWQAWRDSGWLPAKLVLVSALLVFHLYCLQIMHELRTGTARHSAAFYRWINEIPALLLIAIILLVVAKPF
jgi:putative membrane protein